MRQFKVFATLFLINASVQVASADGCVVAIDAGDALSYSTQSINIPSSCSSATINFTHTGSLPAAVMGHNWVLAKTADLQGIQNDGNVAGMSGGYLKDGDSRILAATNIIGGGESTSITFATESLETDGNYSFFCTVMSHSVVMKGAFTISG
jgi:azurin